MTNEITNAFGVIKTTIETSGLTREMKRSLVSDLQGYFYDLCELESNPLCDVETRADFIAKGLAISGV